jgi:iron complex transport system permease protein
VNRAFPGYLRSWLFWIALAVAVYFLCLMLGQGEFGSGTLRLGWPSPELYDQRWRRVLAAALVGFALAGAGVTLQALLRNPLADPYVLGISSGSAVGVMAWALLLTVVPQAVLHAPDFLLAAGRAIPAVIGAVITCILVFFLAQGRSRRGEVEAVQPVTLLLVGVVVSSMNAALLMLLNALAPHGLRSDMAVYLLGSISENELTLGMLRAAEIILLLGYLPVLLASRALNIASLSDVEATSLGVNIRRLRTIAFVCASVMTAAALLLSGPIGFVGLICPHICRSLVGPDHRKLLVAAPLCGAAFLMLADTAVRLAVMLNHGQLPVGVVTALCGGPFFLWLLRRKSSRMGAAA